VSFFFFLEEEGEEVEVEVEFAFLASIARREESKSISLPRAVPGSFLPNFLTRQRTHVIVETRRGRGQGERKRKSARELADGNESSGGIAAAAVLVISAMGTQERERELRRRAALPPLHSLLSSRDTISIPRRIHRESNRRENAEGASSTSRQKQVKKNSRDLISLFAEKKSRQNRPPPFPPADSSSAVAHRLHFAQGHREQINGQLTLARIVAVAFLGKELRRCGEESFFLAL
jgi:hypothetical protein